MFSTYYQANAWAKRWRIVRIRKSVYDTIEKLMRPEESRGDVVMLAVRLLEEARAGHP